MFFMMLMPYWIFLCVFVLAPLVVLAFFRPWDVFDDGTPAYSFRGVLVSLLLLTGCFTVFTSFCLSDFGCGIARVFCSAYVRCFDVCFARRKAYVHTTGATSNPVLAQSASYMPTVYLVHPGCSDLSSGSGLKTSLLGLAVLKRFNPSLVWLSVSSLVWPELPFVSLLFKQAGVLFYDPHARGTLAVRLRQNFVVAQVAPGYTVSQLGDVDMETVSTVCGIFSELLTSFTSPVQIVPVYIDGEEPEESYLGYLARILWSGFPDYAVTLCRPVILHPCGSGKLNPQLVRPYLTQYFTNLQSGRRFSEEERNATSARV